MSDVLSSQKRVVASPGSYKTLTDREKATLGKLFSDFTVYMAGDRLPVILSDEASVSGMVEFDAGLMKSGGRTAMSTGKEKGIIIASNVEYAYGSHMTKANQVRLMIDSLNHEAEHHLMDIEDDLFNKQREFISRFDKEKAELADYVFNVVEDSFVDHIRIEKYPGMKRRYAFKCKALADKFPDVKTHWNDRTHDAYSVLTDGLMQLKWCGNVKGFDVVPDNLKAELNAMKTLVDMVKKTDSIDQRIMISHSMVNRISKHMTDNTAPMPPGMPAPGDYDPGESEKKWDKDLHDDYNDKQDEIEDKQNKQGEQKNEAETETQDEVGDEGDTGEDSIDDDDNGTGGGDSDNMDMQDDDVDEDDLSGSETQESDEEDDTADGDFDDQQGSDSDGTSDDAGDGQGNTEKVGMTDDQISDIMNDAAQKISNTFEEGLSNVEQIANHLGLSVDDTINLDKPSERDVDVTAELSTKSLECDTDSMAILKRQREDRRNISWGIDAHEIHDLLRKSHFDALDSAFKRVQDDYRNVPHYKGGSININNIIKFESGDLTSMKWYDNKEIRDKRRRTIMILLDMSTSVNDGDGGTEKYVNGRWCVDNTFSQRDSQFGKELLATMLITKAAEKAGDRVGIIGFCGDSDTPLIKLPDEKFRVSLFDNLHTNGVTPMEKAMSTGRRMLRAEPGSFKKLMIIITDGVPNVVEAGRLTDDCKQLAKNQIRAASREGVETIGVGIGFDDYQSKQGMTEIFGSNYINVENFSKLVGEFCKLYIRIMDGPYGGRR